jgi:exportin-5
VDLTPRQARLESFLHPLISSWQSPGLAPSLCTFDGFCELLGLGNLQQYIIARAFHQMKDWSSCPLDEEGKLLQLKMQNALEVSMYSSLKFYLSA